MISDDELAGILRLSTRLGTRPGLFYAVDIARSGAALKVCRLTEAGIGPWRIIGRDQARRIIDTGEINWIDVEGSSQRKRAAATAHMDRGKEPIRKSAAIAPARSLRPRLRKRAG